MDRRRLDGRLVRRFIPVLLVALSLGCSVDPTGRYLIMIAALFLLGAVGEIVFARTQIPDVVWLILAGVVLNATGLVNPSNLDPILPLFSALTLIIVLFDGGRQIVIEDLIKAAPRASASNSWSRRSAFSVARVRTSHGSVSPCNSSVPITTTKVRNTM